MYEGKLYTPRAVNYSLDVSYSIALLDEMVSVALSIVHVGIIYRSAEL